MDFNEMAGNAKDEADQRARASKPLSEKDISLLYAGLKGRLDSIARNTSEYLVKSNVAPTPVANVLSPYPWSKRDRVRIVGHAWEFDSKICLDDNLNWNLRNGTGAVEWYRRGMSRTNGGSARKTIQGSLLSADAKSLISYFKASPDGANSLFADILIGRSWTVGLHYRADGYLTLQENRDTPEGECYEFESWIATRAGRMAAGQS